MPQSEIVPVAWKRSSYAKEENFNSELFLESSSHSIDVCFSFEQVAEDVYRTTCTTSNHPLPPWPSIPRHNGNGGREGNAVVQNGSYALQNGTHTIGNGTHPPLATTSFSISSDFAVAKVHWDDGPPLITVTLKTEPTTPIHKDLPHRSYILDGPGIAHYTQYNRSAIHIGLGEKAAPMDLSNRHFILSATDCFGYDAHRSDPLYKHIPLLITATAEYAVATFSSSHSRGTYSVGSEIDGMWGRYKVYRQDFGGLEEYLIVGRTIQDVLRKYADLVGYPLLVPRWAFGYLAGGMKYSMLDSPRASDALIEFADKLKEHDIPCSGFQLSSGYTVAEQEPKTRNVFTWNRHRFPDPKGWADEYHARGIRIIANVKPYVLDSHPEYNRLRAAGTLFRDSRTGKSAEARLWSAGGGESGVGGHIDFTSNAGYDFWVNGVKGLRELGIDCIWNDNNEFTIPDDQWQCALSDDIVPDAPSKTNSKYVGLWGRYMHTELMGKASHDAVVSVKPKERPFVLTRSATAGTMRYCASTWSGDNVTSWESMKGANALSLTAGVSLLQCYGHDIGGFEGPQPSPELLLRWVQLGIHSPRFAINCFKTSPADNSVGDVIEPWMYPSITPLVRAAIRRRYELIPYLYSLMLRSHLYAEPPVRWTGLGYEGDEVVWKDKVLREGETQYWLGEALLVGGVYERGGKVARMYLPSNAQDATDRKEQLLNLNPPHQYLAAGQWVDIPAKWDESIPLLAKVGTLIPVGKPEQVVASFKEKDSISAELPFDDYRAVELFPPPASFGPSQHFVNSWLEDDGISPAPSAVLKIELTYASDERVVDIVGYEQEMLRSEGRVYAPLWKELHFVLPVGDERVVTVRGAPTERTSTDLKGRAMYRAGVEALLAKAA